MLFPLPTLVKICEKLFVIVHSIVMSKYKAYLISSGISYTNTTKIILYSYCRMLKIYMEHMIAFIATKKTPEKNNYVNIWP